MEPREENIVNAMRRMKAELIKTGHLEDDE
jgi:hypothetical protein